MLVKLLEIMWHTQEPVFSADFHSSGRIATCGGDNTIKIWRLEKGTGGELQAKFLSSLNFHLQHVNCVRFSPDGRVLASISDDGFLFLWQLSTSAVESTFGAQDDDVPNVEHWVRVKAVNAHKQDIYDLAWARDSDHLATGASDNQVFVRKLSSNKVVNSMFDHTNFVQGVAWDPQGEFLASQSSDRTVRIYRNKRKGAALPPQGDASSKSPNFSWVHTNKHRQVMPLEWWGSLEAAEGKEPVAARHALYHHANLYTFIRRLAWSPEGEILVTPAGIFQASLDSPPSNCTYVYYRTSLDKPALQLPCGDSASVAVRFSPIKFNIRQEYDTPWPSPWLNAPHRWVFAVATETEVILYDTQTPHAIGRVSCMHLASITDLAWSHDGKCLFVTSLDGYCSVVLFDEGELGKAMA